MKNGISILNFLNVVHFFFLFSLTGHPDVLQSRKVREGANELQICGWSGCDALDRSCSVGCSSWRAGNRVAGWPWEPGMEGQMPWGHLGRGGQTCLESGQRDGLGILIQEAGRKVEMFSLC